MANIIFLEAGTDSTFDRLLFSAFSGSSASDTSQAHDGLHSLKCDSTVSNTAAYCDKSGCLADAGRRVSFWLRFSALPATSPRVFSAMTSGAAATCVSLDVRSTGKLSIETATTNFDGTTVLSTNTWYRVTFSYTISSTTVNSFKVWLNGVLEINQTNITLGNVSTNTMRIGMVQAFGASKQVWIDSIYVDDGTDLGDPGTTAGLSCTAKLYVGTSEGVGFNDWDTFGGTNRSLGSHYLNVSERADSDTNFWQQAGNTQAYEKYLIEGAGAGDVDMSAGTLVGWMAWVRAKTSAGSSVASIVDNDVDTAITTTTTPGQFFHATTSATYPTGRFGMRSTGTATDTFFYEGGVIVAYIPLRTQALTLTSTATLARALQATKTPATSVQSDTTRTVSRQTTKSPATSAQSDTTRTIRRQTNKFSATFAQSDTTRTVSRSSGKIAAASASAALSYGPTAVARALGLASAGVLARMADVTHLLGPLPVNSITPALQRQAGKTPQASGSGTPTRDPTVVGKVPAVTAVGVLDRLLLVAQSARSFTSRAIQDRAVQVGKAASAASSSLLSLLAESLGNTYMQALDAASSAVLALRRAVGTTSTGASTAAPTRTLAPAVSVPVSASGGPALASALTVLRALLATSTAGPARVLVALKGLAGGSTATGTRSVLVDALRTGAGAASAMLQAGAQTAYSVLLTLTSSAGQQLARAVAVTERAAAGAAGAAQKAVAARQAAAGSGAGLLTAARHALAALVAGGAGAGRLTRAAQTILPAGSAGAPARTVAVSSVRQALGTGGAALRSSFLYSLALSAASLATSALVRGVQWERRAQSVGVGALQRGVGKLLNLVAAGLAALERLRAFRPGRPPAVNRRAVSIMPANTGDVQLQTRTARAVSIRSEDHADV